MHIAVLLWGFTGVLGKAISLGAYSLVTYRVLFTLLLLLLIVTVIKGWQFVGKKLSVQLLCIGAAIGVHWVFFYASIKESNASIALICLSTSGIISALLEPIFFKKKLNVKELLLACIAVAGMGLIYKLETQYTTGIILGVIAAIISVLFTIANKKLATNHNPLLISTHHMVGAIITLVALIPLYSNYIEVQNWQLSWKDIKLLFCLALFCTVIGQALSLFALKQLSTFTVILTVNLEPVYGIVLAILLVNEAYVLTPAFIAGMALIGLSVVLHILLQIKERKHRLR